MLIKFFRKKNVRCGVLVGVRFGNAFYIGCSLCCDRDYFDKNKGLEIAYGRALAASKYNKDIVIPFSMIDDFLNFYERCETYFKDCEAVPDIYVIENYDKGECIPVFPSNFV